MSCGAQKLLQNLPARATRKDQKHQKLNIHENETTGNVYGIVISIAEMLQKNFGLKISTGYGSILGRPIHACNSSFSIHTFYTFFVVTTFLGRTKFSKLAEGQQ